MDIERETIVQIVVSTVAVATFVAAAIYVSTTYRTAGGALTEQGGVALVGAIGLFVLVMMAAGLFLERSEKF